MRNITIRRTALTGAAALSLILLAAGCGGDGTDHGNMGGNHGGASASAPKTGATFNTADVTFATDMIPHHRQAVEMAGVAETRASSSAVRTLATAISKAQQPEIDVMSGWLRAWGQPLPSHGGGHGSMPGMMTNDEMKQLSTATGKNFDTMFLQMMIKHHQGAVEMARTEQQQGADPAVKKLAEQIATSQAAEITQMQNLLKTV